MLDNLLEHEQIDKAKHAELHRLVLERTGRVVDTDPLYPVPNQTTVLSHGTLRTLRSDPDVLRKQAAAFERKLQLRCLVPRQSAQPVTDATAARLHRNQL